ncbi:MAG: hypothetical protein Q9226_006102 [Calogaya cf. arnoldii]
MIEVTPVSVHYASLWNEASQIIRGGSSSYDTRRGAIRAQAYLPAVATDVATPALAMDMRFTHTSLQKGVTQRYVGPQKESSYGKGVTHAVSGVETDDHIYQGKFDVRMTTNHDAVRSTATPTFAEMWDA